MKDELPSPDTPVQPSSRTLRPAAPSDVVDTPAFALRYRGRKRIDAAGEAMARITAERLMAHLEQSGFVVMHRAPPGSGPGMRYALPVVTIAR